MHPAPASSREPSPSARYQGPERRSGVSLAVQTMSRLLDEVDYGMLLMTESADVLYTNRAAALELDAQHPLQVRGGRLHTPTDRDDLSLQNAIVNAARRGLRCLLRIGHGAARINVAVTPAGVGSALIVLGRRRLSERLSMQLFSHLHGLTPAETRVLEGLCDGRDPKEVADLNAVGVSTIRTQIGNIRAKTEADSIRALVRQVAALPPMMGVLR